MSNKVLIIIPTYNEVENIESIINVVFDISADYHVLVVDDGSPDRTADIVKSLQTKYSSRLHIIERSGKLGLGTAYITGFNFAIDKSYDFIIEMDADFSHPPQKLPELVSACINGADVSVGSRYTKGGGVKNWPVDRLALSFGASMFVRTITWMPVKDPTAGFVCYTREVLEAIDFDQIQFVGYAFQIEMKYTAHRLGFSIAEVPITFKDRELGVSKMNSSIIKEAILGVFKMRMRKYERA